MSSTTDDLTSYLTMFRRVILRIRQNHGLEHATLHMLAKRKPTTSLAGQSDYWGFWIIGDVSESEVEESAQEALTRLQAGESQWVVHPNCGTNLVASALLGSLAVLGGFAGSGKHLRDKLERFPLAITLVSLSLVLARPFGTWLQSHLTTSSAAKGVQIQSVKTINRGWIRAKRVQTQG